MLSHATACGKLGKGKAKTSQNMSEPKCKIHQDENVVCKFGILPSILPDRNSRHFSEDDRADVQTRMASVRISTALRAKKRRRFRSHTQLLKPAAWCRLHKQMGVSKNSAYDGTR